MAAQCPHLPLSPDRKVLAAIDKSHSCGVKGCSRGSTNDAWICTACGFAGCPREGLGHALAHFTQYPSHAVAINKQTMIWCYACDSELNSSDNFSADFNAALETYRLAALPAERRAEVEKLNKASRNATTSAATAAPLRRGSVGAGGAQQQPQQPAGSSSVRIATISSRKDGDPQIPLLARYPPTGGLTGLANAG
jgi:uncharacterized UBP type Zn finger protein